jgi:proteic killer suppression protein
LRTLSEAGKKCPAGYCGAGKEPCFPVSREVQNNNDTVKITPDPNGCSGFLVAIHNEYRYYSPMITSFVCRETELVFNGRFSRRLPHDISRVAERKLRLIHRAMSLNDLRIPPANHLEALKDDRAGQHSIRINDQWRICFTWKDGNATNVEIVDYH